LKCALRHILSAWLNREGFGREDIWLTVCCSACLELLTCSSVWDCYKLASDRTVRRDLRLTNSLVRCRKDECEGI